MQPVTELVPTDLDFLTSAPLQIHATAHLRVPPDRVFEAFADIHMWPRWWPQMYEARWTHGEPGLGAEREVAIRLLGRYRERMIAWEPGTRYAFTMTATNSPMASQIAEDYRLVADGKGTRVDWTLAATPRTLGKLATPIMRVLMKRMFRTGFTTLDKLLASN
jgi:uncharacterized protein YndB with AHSA1/START domain